MKIESAIPRGQPAVIGTQKVDWTSPSPGVQPYREEHGVAQDVPARRAVQWRGGLSSLRHQALQNAPVVRADATPPGVNSTDRQLVDELKKYFDELSPQDGRLVQSSLSQFAAQMLPGE